MSPGWTLGITAASALVLLLGVALKTRHAIRDELEKYASGYNRAEAAGRFEDRYDARVASALLVLALGLQVASLSAVPSGPPPPPWIITLQALASLAWALLAWCLPRGPLVRKNVQRLEADITERWKRSDEAAAQRRERA